MKLIHWPLMRRLLHLVQQGGDWAGYGPAQSPPCCTKCNSPSIIGQCINHRIAVKVKVWTLVIAPLTRVSLVTSSALQSRKWQLIGMSQYCRSALCGHPLPALTDSRTHGAPSRHTIATISHTRPSPCSRSYYSFPVPLRRLSWHEHRVGQQLAQGCLQWTGCESNPQPLGYESDTLPLLHCTHNDPLLCGFNVPIKALIDTRPFD